MLASEGRRRAIFAFADCELDGAAYELRRAGERVPLEPKVLELLVYLLTERGRVVAKRELHDALWPGVAVSGSSLTRCVSAARRALGDDGKRPAMIRTVYGRGYHFVAPVRERIPEPPVADPPTERVAELPSAPPALRAPFVGRRREFTALRAAAAEAFGGRGQLVLLVGGAGMGKSRVLDELSVWAGGQGASVRRGACREEEGAPAFWPWLQILADEVARRAPDELAELLGSGAPEIAELFPELRSRLGVVAAAPELEPVQARFRLFESLARFWRAAARSQPLLLLLDDIHRADLASLRLLHFIGAAVGDTPMLVVAAYREGDITGDPACAGRISRLARLARATRLPLDGLSREEVAEFVQATTGAAADAARVAALRDHTGGNPFFLTQIVPRLKISATADGSVGFSEEIARSPGVRGAVARQLDGVPDVTRRLLGLGAILGREFAVAPLAIATGEDQHVLRDRIQPALAAGILTEAGCDRRFRFAHVLVRDVLYEELRPGERRRWHRHIGEALELLHAGELDDHASELAHHFGQAATAGTRARAIRYAERAASRAEGQLAYEQAAQHYQRALELLEEQSPVDERLRIALLLMLAQAQVRAERRREATAACARAAQLARDLGADDELARAALVLAPGLYILNTGRLDCGVVIPLLEEAAAALAGEESALRVRVLARLAMCLPLDADRRRALSAEALGVAERVGDRAGVVVARGARVVCSWGPDGFEERCSSLPEIVELAEAVGDRELALVYRDCWIATLLESGDVGAADREIEVFAQIAARLRHPRAIAFAANHATTRALMAGRLADAERTIERFLGTFARLRDRGGIGGFGLKLTLLRCEQGRLDEVEPIARTFRRLAEWSPEEHEWQCVEAWVAVAVGDLGRARVVFRELAKDEFARLPRHRLWLFEMVALADVCGALEEAAVARQLYALLQPYRHRLGVAGFTAIACWGAVSRPLGVLAGIAGHRERAIAHFEAALTQEARIGAHACRVHTQLDYARFLAGAEGEGDRQRAKELAAEALATARALGAGGPASDLLALQAQLG